MKIENLKQLQKLIQLCRKTGVEAIEVDNIKMNLGPVPKTVIHKQQSIAISSFNQDGITAETQIPTTGLTDDQLLFYSSQDHLPNEQQ